MDGKGMENIRDKVGKNIGKVIIGKEKIIKYLLTALFSGGHVLLEDMPGTGKTKLAKSLALSLDAGFSRVQFTPDLLPSDVTGLNVFNRKTGDFDLRKGPVFTNILLGDEINRATPRTQAGLLECMEERQVTIDGESYLLEDPFLVIATQNPVDTAGTFPLPEAQMDRFMMKLSMGLPDREEELGIMDRFMEEDPLEDLKPVMGKEDLHRVKAWIRKVYVHPVVKKYILDIVFATREQGKVVAGISPRGTIALLHSAKAFAALGGRDYVIPDDIKELAVPVLAHRLILPYGHGQGKDSGEFIKSILGEIPVPTEDFKRIIS